MNEVDNLDSGLLVREREPLRDQAVRLFESLAREYQLTNPAPRTVDSYARDGMLLWLDDLPRHPAITSVHHEATLESGRLLLIIDRLACADPPAPDPVLAPWLDGDVTDVACPPRLRVVPASTTEATDEVNSATTTEATDAGDRVELSHVRDLYADWLTRWWPWAVRERVERPVRGVYGELLSAYQAMDARPGELELVLGVGCLAWRPPGHQAVRRHMLTAPLTIHLDADTGRLTVVLAASVAPLAVELDMFDPGVAESPDIDDIRRSARQSQRHPLHREATGALVRRLVHALDDGGEYRPEDGPSGYSYHPVATFAPAIVLRERPGRGVLGILRAVLARLRADGMVPDGVLPLFGAGDALTGTDALGAAGTAMAGADRVSPPSGVDRCQAIAGVVSELLARGERVLVVARGDGDSLGVRAALPEDMRPLSFAVCGTPQDNMADLDVALAAIETVATNHDEEGSRAVIDGHAERVEELRSRAEDARRELAAGYEREAIVYQHGPYAGTLAAIARERTGQAARLSWLGEYVTVAAEIGAPLSTPEVLEWHRYLLDGDLIRDSSDAAQPLVDVTEVPTPRAFAELIATEGDALAEDTVQRPLKDHPAFMAIGKLGHLERDDLRTRLEGLTAEITYLTHGPESWLPGAVTDVCSGRADAWESCGRQIAELIERCAPLISLLGQSTSVDVTSGEKDSVLAMAKAVRLHLSAGGTIKLLPDGAPRIGVFSPGVIKRAKPLFERVRVNGLAPITMWRLDAFLAWEELTANLAELDGAWPSQVGVMAEGTLYERLRWHTAALDVLQRVCAVNARIQREQNDLVRAGLPSLDWGDLASVRTYIDVIEAVAVEEVKEAASEPLRRLARLLGQPGMSNHFQRLARAVGGRDPVAYVAAYDRIEHLRQVRDSLIRRDDLAARLSAAAPRLRAAVAAAPDAACWADRLPTFTEAWMWAEAGSWALGQQAVDIGVLHAKTSEAEAEVRQGAEALSVAQAWGHVVSSRRAPGVPAWIVPLDRLVEQLDIGPDMFDVVVLGGVPPSGVEVAFSRYLAPRVVVVDDCE